MGLIIGLIIIATTCIWTLKQIDKLEEPCFYETAYCRDIRATEGMVIGAFELEKARLRVNSKKSKF